MPLSREELDGLDALWRAANYLTVGQIDLEDNPLLREPLRPEHVKPRLLGHWGADPRSAQSLPSALGEEDGHRDHIAAN